MVDTADEEMVDDANGKQVEVLVLGVVHQVCEDVNRVESSLIQGLRFASFGSPNVIVSLSVENEKETDEEMVDAANGKQVEVLVLGVFHQVCEDVNRVESSLIQGKYSPNSQDVLTTALVDARDATAPSGA
nr:hypothetical protein [Tanacetum cinerariifolium]